MVSAVRREQASRARVASGRPPRRAACARSTLRPLVALDALRFRRTGCLLAGAEPGDQVGDVGELLLEVALVFLQPFEDVLPVVPPAAEAAVMSSASVVHGHLPSKRSRNVSMLSRERRRAAAHSSSRRRPAAVSS